MANYLAVEVTRPGLTAKTPLRRTLSLHLSFKTVETYRDRIRQKLDLEDGTKLAHHATQRKPEHG
jgi:hypothetical protein